MRDLVLTAAAFALSAIPANAQTPDPFARSRDGAIECFGPNVAARTCEAISGYRFQSDGQVLSDVAMIIQDQPLMVLTGTSTVYARDGMICERVERATVDRARITVDGAEAPDEVSRQVKDAIWSAVANIREMCSRFIPEGNGARVAIYADGVEVPEMADQVIWVRPEDGYTLAAPAETSAT